MEIPNKNQGSVINSFTENYSFLSNSFLCDMEFEHIPYSNAESCFQSLKFLRPKSRNIFRNMPPRKAYIQGQEIKRLRAGWEDIKDTLMLQVVTAKFIQNSELEDMLVSTQGKEIINGNLYHDTYWGVCYCGRCQGQGLNKLGRILMAVRDKTLTRYEGCPNELTIQDVFPEDYRDGKIIKIEKEPPRQKPLETPEDFQLERKWFFSP